FHHPEWIAENCTACGKCWTVCPDTAIPGLVSEVGAVFDTVVRRLRKAGRPLEHLQRALRETERHLRMLFDGARETDPVGELLEEAIQATLAGSTLEPEAKEKLAGEFGWFREELGGFRFALTRPYFTLPEQQRKGSGGLLSITVNPTTCKGCME